MEKKRLVISSNGLNRYGYRVLTAGIKTDAYEKNPVLLLGHSTYGLPIGRVEDLKKHADGTMSCLPIFDENDEMGAAASHKWENGFLFAASIGFNPLKLSSDPKDLLPGQNRETVLECDLLEISMVAVPGNVDAATGLALSAYSDTAIPPISPITVHPNMEKIALALGLMAAATEADVLAAIGKLQGDVKTLGLARVDALLEQGKANGIVTDANLDNWRTLAATNYEQAAAIIGAAKPAVIPESKPAASAGQTLVGQLSAPKPGEQGKPADERAGWSFNDWSKKDSKGLAEMRKTDPTRYAALAAAQYESV